MSHVRYRSHDAADSAPPRANLRQLVARTTTESRTFSVGQPTPLRRLSATPGAPATTRRQNDDRTSHVRCRSTDSADSAPPPANLRHLRPEEHTPELQSLLRHSYADLCLKTK